MLAVVENIAGTILHYHEYVVGENDWFNAVMINISVGGCTNSIKNNNDSAANSRFLFGNLALCEKKHFLQNLWGLALPSLSSDQENCFLHFSHFTLLRVDIDLLY